MVPGMWPVPPVSPRNRTQRELPQTFRTWGCLRGEELNLAPGRTHLISHTCEPVLPTGKSILDGSPIITDLIQTSNYAIL